MVSCSGGVVKREAAYPPAGRNEAVLASYLYVRLVVPDGNWIIVEGLDTEPTAVMAGGGTCTAAPAAMWDCSQT